MRNKRFVAAILSALLIFGQVGADASVVYAQEKTGTADTQAFEVELLSESEQSETDEPASVTESEETEAAATEETSEALSEDESEALTEESSEALEEKKEELSSESADERETESSEEADEKKDKIAEIEDTEGIHLNKYAELDPVTLVGGSDGVIHEGVEYLSAGTVARFNDEMLDAYIEMCDNAVELLGEMSDAEEIGFYATESGEIGMTFFVPFETYAEPDAVNGASEVDIKAAETVSGTESNEPAS